MHLWNTFRRWTSDSPEPTAPPSNPIQPQPDTSSSHSWLTSKTRRALSAFHHARDRAACLLCVKDFGGKTEENARIVPRRPDTVGPPVLGALVFPSLMGLVREAGVDVWDDVSPIEEQGLRVQGLLTPSPVYYRVKEIGKLFEEIRGLALAASQAESQSQVPRAVGVPSRYASPSHPVPRSEAQEEQKQEQGSKHETIHEESPELLPRPSCVPDNYDIPLPDMEEDEEIRFGTAVEGRVTRCQRVLTVPRARPFSDHNSRLLDIEEEDECPSEVEEFEIGTAVQGRVTRCQRVLDVCRADLVPEEYRIWGLASRASFSNSKPPSDGEAVGEEVSSDDSSEEYEPEEIPLYRCHAHEHIDTDSSSFFSDSFSDSFSDHPLWSCDFTPEQYHLHHIRLALSLPATTPRRHIEGWLIRNPSVPYHLLTATVPSGPGALRLASDAAVERENADLEWHLRGVEWEIFRVGRVHRRRRVGGIGRKSLGSRGVVSEELGLDGGWVRAPLGPSKLRGCEGAG